MKALRLKEFLCVVVLVLFVFSVTAQKKNSDSSVEDVGKAVSESVATEGLTLCAAEKFQKEFALSANVYEGVYYLASNDVMDVREVLVVRLADGADADALLDSVRSRIEAKIVLFEGYAAEQTALLKDYTLVQRGNFVLFAVCDAPENAVRAWKGAL